MNYACSNGRMTVRGSWERLAEALNDRRRLTCSQCGLIDDGRRPGWTLFLSGSPDLNAFCPDCDPRAFD